VAKQGVFRIPLPLCRLQRTSVARFANSPTLMRTCPAILDSARTGRLDGMDRLENVFHQTLHMLSNAFGVSCRPKPAASSSNYRTTASVVLAAPAAVSFTPPLDRTCRCLTGSCTKPSQEGKHASPASPGKHAHCAGGVLARKPPGRSSNCVSP
jgi:hypothetical protein